MSLVNSDVSESLELRTYVPPARWIMEGDDLEGGARQWVEANTLELKMQQLLCSRKRRECEVEHVEIRMDCQRIQRSWTVKCLRVLVDDGLLNIWKEQVWGSNVLLDWTRQECVGHVKKANQCDAT